MMEYKDERDLRLLIEQSRSGAQTEDNNDEDDVFEVYETGIVKRGIKKQFWRGLGYLTRRRSILEVFTWTGKITECAANRK